AKRSRKGYFRVSLMGSENKATARRPVPSRKRRARRALSRRTDGFGESVIREMSRFGAEVGGINLAQGLPDFEPPREVLAALSRAIREPGAHQYSFTWGSPEFRAAVAEKSARYN